MTATVAIAGVGEMGSALAARMTKQGIRVITFEPRSSRTRDRATAAGVEIVPDRQIVQADFFFSIVPSDVALALADRVATLCENSEAAPVYCDWNAISPSLVGTIAKRIGEAGLSMIDGGIIGLAPKTTEGPGPKLFASGSAATRLAELSPCGLDFSILDANIGAASALKLSYASITKGVIAIASASARAAAAYGCGDALVAELGRSQPAFLNSFTASVPNMLPKAGRWVAEMDEISAYLEGHTPSSEIYRAISSFYADTAENETMRDLLHTFFDPKA